MGFCCEAIHCGFKTILMAAIIAGITLMIIYHQRMLGWLALFDTYVKKNPDDGPMLIVAIYVVAELFFVPGAILSVGAGYTLKRAYNDENKAIWIGSASIFIGGCIAATLGFFIGRYIMRSCAEQMSRRFKVFKALDLAMGSDGLTLMFLLRLSPVIPFAPLNFICGITTMNYCKFLASMVAQIPCTFVYVFIGTSLSELT